MFAVVSSRRPSSRREFFLSERGRGRALTDRARVVRRGTGLMLGLFLLSWGLLAPPGAQAIPTPAQDPFYAYQGATPLASIPPGTVLKTRTLSYTSWAFRCRSGRSSSCTGRRGSLGNRR